MNKLLRDLADIHYGKSPNEVFSDDSSIPVVGTGGIYGRAFRAMFPGPAIVVPRKGSLGNPQYVGTPFWPADTTFAVIAKNGVDVKWLYYQLAAFDLTKLNEATGVPSISRDWLYRTNLCWDDYKIQCRIAEILSTIDDAIEQTEALIAKHQQIKAGLMHDLFTRGVTPDGRLRPPRAEAPHLYKQSPLGWIPKEWEIERLGDLTPVSAPICYGILQPGDHHHDGVPVIAIYNLNSSYDLIHRCSPSIEARYTRSRVQGSDVVLSIKGSIGRVDVIPWNFVGNISRDVARIRPRTGINASYLRYLIESARMQTQLMRISVGTTRYELSIGPIRKLWITISQPHEQSITAQRLVQIDEYLRSEQENLQKFLLCKRGLMYDLLFGRVPVRAFERGEA